MNKMIPLEAAKKAIKAQYYYAEGVGFVMDFDDAMKALDSIAVPVEDGAIEIVKKDDGYWLQLNGPHSSAVIKIESASEIVMKTIADVADLEQKIKEQIP